MNSCTAHSSPVVTEPPAPQQPVLLTPKQLARRLGISRRSLSSWTRAKIVPMIKVGRVCRFDLDRVRDALELYEQGVDARRAQGIDTSKVPWLGCSTCGALQSIQSDAPAATLSTPGPARS